MKRHFHRGGRTIITEKGTLFFSVAESRNLFVSPNGTFITRFNTDGTYLGSPHGDRGGYLSIKVGASKAFCHRVVFEVCTNAEIPDDAELDHINGNPKDNRLANLRVVHSRKENMRNPITVERQKNHLAKLALDDEMIKRRNRAIRIFHSNKARGRSGKSTC